MTSKVQNLVNQLYSRIEKKIISAAVFDLVKAGYKLEVLPRYGESGSSPNIQISPKGVMQKISSVLKDGYSQINIYVYKNSHSLKPVGWVYLVCDRGEDCWTVISDYSVNLENQLKRANKLAESYS